MMDLPSDKARILRAYDVHKKWELVCGQQTVTVQGTPGEYIEKLRTFLNDNNKSTNKKVSSWVFVIRESICVCRNKRNSSARTTRLSC